MTFTVEINVGNVASLYDAGIKTTVFQNPNTIFKHSQYCVDVGVTSVVEWPSLDAVGAKKWNRMRHPSSNYRKYTFYERSVWDCTHEITFH